MRGGAIRRLLGLALCLGSALSMSACGITLIPVAPRAHSPTATPAARASAAQLAGEAVNDWGNGAAEHFQGTLSASGIALSVDVTLAFGSSGAGLGTGTANNAPFQFLSSSRTAYLKGQSFWQTYYTGQSQEQLMAKGYQENFTVADNNNVALAIAQLPNLAGAVSELSSDMHSVRRGAPRTIGGRSAIALSEGDTTWWVTRQRPVALVGLKTPVQGGLQNVDLTMQASSSAPTDLTGQLGSPVDPNNPSTMPALYQAVDVTVADQNNCTNVGCGFNVTVLNQEGPAAGQGVVTVSTYANQTSTNVLAACTANIPSGLGTNQTTVVTCRVSGPGWQAYSGTRFAYKAAVTSNPPYL